MPTPSPAAAPVQVALLTPPGRGALAVVGLRGRGAADLADRRFHPRRGPPLAARPDGSIAVGIWQATIDASGEELVVVRHAADRVEVHCHGGTAAAGAVIASLVAAGGVPQAWPEWLADRAGDPVALEARRSLATAAGPRAARILCRQLAGSLSAELARLAALPAGEDRRQAAKSLLRASRVGLRLTEPWRVVLAGDVNAGKSSLANALAGHARSIVSEVPGTTRDLVATRLVLGGWEVELIDTAGERADLPAASPTEAAGIARAIAARGQADLVLRVVPAGQPAPPPNPDELVVITKADLAAAAPPALRGGVVTSAVTGQGMADLESRIVAALVPEEQAEPGLLDGPVPFTDRQVEVVQGWIVPVIRT